VFVDDVQDVAIDTSPPAGTTEPAPR
jgi:hypothetical protein